MPHLLNVILLNVLIFFQHQRHTQAQTTDRKRLIDDAIVYTDEKGSLNINTTVKGGGLVVNGVNCGDGNGKPTIHDILPRIDNILS
eukprot:m.43309 g.43309  ORF g.43309 m.43309 type:complete len:86 (+) comp7105_c0_seq1:78-335(+)